jgi:hypothetical protein
MKALNQKLIATVAAVLLTSASLMTTATLSMAPQNADAQEINANEIHGLKVTNLREVIVHPSASELRSASLLTDIGAAGFASLGRIGTDGGATQLSLLGSQLAMPYYSFGNKFGRISKE